MRGATEVNRHEHPAVFNSLSGDELRRKYVEFFRQRGHVAIPSASLIPDNDPTVLFTTAGMHPLIPYLLGQDHPSGTRLVDYQKCVRTNDIEEVGDLTHLTLFEMLGNWSLGDYFKDESIKWSFEFLTRKDCLGIPADRVWVTVFAGTERIPRDDYSAGVWQSLGIAPDRIIYLGEEHNWWATGDEGPCGPDTEIFIDMTGEPCDNGSECLPGLCNCGRFFEIWNNVFMTYRRSAGQLYDLPKKNVDTGMGLERTLAALNGVESVYDTSVFKPLVTALIAQAKFDEATIRRDEKLTRALRVLADHMRTSVFILGDEKIVTPSNQGQGYVLRRLIRRAIRFCSELGIAPATWEQNSDIVVEMFRDAYPEIGRNRDRVVRELALERGRFERTLEKGTQILQKEIGALKTSGRRELSGETAFHLYDTYGFPIEFTSELAAEHGISIDLDGYARQAEQHRERSRSEAAKSGLADTSEESIRYHTATHLLHAALRDVLGAGVQQMGSNITRERMRFDFSYPRAMSKEQVDKVESLVQSWIDADLPVTSSHMSKDDAMKSGAIGLFQDRYGGDVTVYQIGDVSRELCGGPHVQNTAEIGRFKIQKEQSSSAGVRRIRAKIE
jgi:alanyl-tRNA synthetase